MMEKFRICIASSHERSALRYSTIFRTQKPGLGNVARLNGHGIAASQSPPKRTNNFFEFFAPEHPKHRNGCKKPHDTARSTLIKDTKEGVGINDWPKQLQYCVGSCATDNR